MPNEPFVYAGTRGRVVLRARAAARTTRRNDPVAGAGCVNEFSPENYTSDGCIVGVRSFLRVNVFSVTFTLTMHAVRGF